MTELPDPLTPADCDLRDFAYMPLDVVRLRDSDLAAIPDAESFRAAILSWCVAWHQVPAASLPDDDAMLCRLLGYGRDLKTWRKVRDGGALHGYRKCSDGRLYHPVVAEKAWEAIERKRKQSERGAKGAQSRWRKHPNGMAQASERDGASIQTEWHDHSASNASLPHEALLKNGKGTEQNREEVPPKPPATEKPPKPVDDEHFSAFWAAYPRKDDKGHARKAWGAAVKKAAPGAIIAGLQRHQFNPDPRYRPLAATWLNGERWGDSSQLLPEAAHPEAPNWNNF